MNRKGSASTRGVHMSDTNCDSRYLVLVSLLATNQVRNVFEVEIVVPYLGQNILELASAWRATRMQN